MDRHVAAAGQMREAVEGMTIAMYPSRDMSAAGIAKHSESGSWLHRLPDHTRRLWLDRFAPWRDKMKVVCGAGTVGALVLAVVIDNVGLRYLETDFRIKHGSAAGIVRRSLDDW